MSEPICSFARATSGLRVALVHDWLTGMRGGEKVLEAIAELFPGAPIYTLFHFPGSVSDQLEAHPIHSSYLQGRWTRPFLRKHYRHLLPLFPSAIEDFDLTEYDLIISTSHCVAKGVIPGPQALHLCYCHSPMRYAWDQEHQYFPKRRGLVARFRTLCISQLRLWDVASCPRVDHFWANSAFVSRRIQRFYGRAAEVLHPPVATQAFKRPNQQDSGMETAADGDRKNDTGTYTIPKGGYALAVSALVPYKKLDRAIQACELRGLELRIVGTGPELTSLKNLCRGNTKLLGRVDDEQLKTLYREASFFIQPGIEDFGIAAVEALAAGIPVVALGRGGVLDIVQDGIHGVLFDSSDPETIAVAIDKSLKIRFNPLELESRAAHFSSQHFTHRLKSSIEDRLASREGSNPERSIRERSGSTAQPTERK